MNKRYLKPICMLLSVFFVLFTISYAGAEKSVLLTFTGDCTLGSEERIRSQESSFDSIAKKRGYDYFFSNFSEMFAQDDQTVINLEGVLSDDNKQEKQSKRYRFRGPTDFVKILKGASIEACSLSNNHIGDYGKQGEESTKAVLDENGIGWFQNFKYYICEKEGIKVAFIALENKVVYNEFDKIKKLINELKESGEANAVAICWHTGMEYHGLHEPNTEKICKTLIRFGADLIVLNHPHVLQGIGVYNNRCIFYSLGNFVFGGNAAIRTEKYKPDKPVTSQYSAVVQVKLLFSDDGKYLGQQPIVYPVITSGSAPVNDYQPYRANNEEAIPIRDALQEDTAFTIPDITVGADGLSRIDLGFLAAFDGVEVPESEADGPQGVPEAPNAMPTRKTKGD